MSKKYLRIGICLLLTVLAGLMLHSYRVGTAPDITFRMIDGRQIAMKDLRGHPVLVTFWATSCAVCLKEMPHMI